MFGKIHSIESMGLVDGPGIRTVIFLNGCALRCCFCHNPDTWSMESGKEMTPKELLTKILRFRPYFEKSGGGITVSGGEPLLQPEFLVEILKLCKENGIHTCLDTAGYGFGAYDEILSYTDLVLYDIKHYEPAVYEKMTGQPIGRTLEFLDALKRSNTKLWIRQVIVPQMTDSIEYLTGLHSYIHSIPNVEKVELLPYHTMGIEKYKALGISYPLDGVESMDKEQTKKLQNTFFGEWRI